MENPTVVIGSALFKNRLWSRSSSRSHACNQDQACEEILAVFSLKSRPCACHDLKAFNLDQPNWMAHGASIF